MLRELSSRPEEVHPDNVEDRPEVVHATPAPLEPLETNNDAPIDDENMVPSTINLPTEEAPSSAHQDNQRPIPHNKSIAHWPISENRAVFVSLDIETRGSYCGIVQISAEIFSTTNTTQGRANNLSQQQNLQRIHQSGSKRFV